MKDPITKVGITAAVISGVFWLLSATALVPWHKLGIVVEPRLDAKSRRRQAVLNAIGATLLALISASCAAYELWFVHGR